jgi:hypothetical protein
MIIFLNAEIVVRKLLDTFLEFNYSFFGPTLFCLCIIGLFNVRDILYICDKKSVNIRVFSYNNLLSYLACFIFSGSVTLITSITVAILSINSAINRSQEIGNESKCLSYVIRRLFWHCIFRFRSPVQLMRANMENEADG